MNIDFEDILITKHVLISISEGVCCSSDDVTCQCKWRGSPSDYGLHLLSALGQEDAIIDTWPYRRMMIEEITPIQREEYLNLFRDPKKKRRISREERKTGVLKS